MGVIDEKLKVVEGKFEELEVLRKDTQDQVSDLNRKLSGIVQEQVRLQGENRALVELRDEGKSEPKPETASPKSEKEKKK